MDYDFTPKYNHLLTRKCSCGGDGEMLIDFVDDFVVRCSKCHLSTHAYIKPETAAKHWNDNDDIMPAPLTIFWDDPHSYLSGEVFAIHVSKNFFSPITSQSIDCDEVILECHDKLLHIENWRSFLGVKTAALNIKELSNFNSEYYCYVILPDKKEHILFENVAFTENGHAVRLEYRWGDTCFFIAAHADSLVIARDTVPYDEVSLATDGDCPIPWKKYGKEVS